MKTRNGRSKEHLPPLGQLLLAWNVGMQRQDLWITSQINCQRQRDAAWFAQLWLCPEFRPSRDCKGFWFPLARARSWKLGLIHSLRFLLFLRGSWKRLQLRHSLKWSCAGQLLNSDRQQPNAVKRQLKNDCSRMTTPLCDAKWNTTVHASHADLDEPAFELFPREQADRKTP